MKAPTSSHLTIKRSLLMVLTIACSVVLSGTAFARGGSGHGGGESHGGEAIEQHGGGRHSGEGFEQHGRRHGTVVSQLPSGFVEISHEGSNHFFHEGRFFDRHHDGFIVISGPIGAVVPNLPVDSARINVGGVTFFASNDNFFRNAPHGFVVVDSPHR